uniref:Uncharacterized protein n=1 Tax=Chromera velia CCMP2878 TaxID=1169474 RepID=A0A0G4GSK1_9ALVE|eukprot:Cvel_23196.t1-p1 / transcript=Cvel_23196.t1 / gene=Cvel_23196 / organism=Chromera_velia_CCMP2878 / gene_product=hypothetical protein / transcript_product=hypothetical protein / location=Cvel_scaffold2363:15591-17756(-) / protein_length=465 / sequence_SO=supercontig / SO=protein_coding / is_pseudo=false
MRVHDSGRKPRRNPGDFSPDAFLSDANLEQELDCACLCLEKSWELLMEVFERSERLPPNIGHVSCMVAESLRAVTHSAWILKHRQRAGRTVLSDGERLEVEERRKAEAAAWSRSWREMVLKFARKGDSICRNIASAEPDLCPTMSEKRYLRGQVQSEPSSQASVASAPSSPRQEGQAEGEAEEDVQEERAGGEGDERGRPSAHQQETADARSGHTDERGNANQAGLRERSDQTERESRHGSRNQTSGPPHRGTDSRSSTASEHENGRRDTPIHRPPHETVGVQTDSVQMTKQGEKKGIFGRWRPKSSSSDAAGVPEPLPPSAASVSGKAEDKKAVPPEPPTQQMTKKGEKKGIFGWGRSKSSSSDAAGVAEPPPSSGASVSGNAEDTKAVHAEPPTQKKTKKEEKKGIFGWGRSKSSSSDAAGVAEPPPSSAAPVSAKAEDKKAVHPEPPTQQMTKKGEKKGIFG